MLASLVLVASVAAPGVGQNPSSRAACARIAWTPPTAVSDATGRPFYIESPEVLRAGDTLWLFGGPTWQRDSTGAVHAWAGVRLEVHETRGVLRIGAASGLPLPAGQLRLAIPRVARLPDGAIVALWRGSAPGEDPLTITSRVMTAELRGERWSIPRTLLDTGRRVPWVTSEVSAVARIGGVPTVAVASNHGDSTALLVAASGGWAARWLRFAPHDYTQVAPLDDDQRSIVLAYNAPGGPLQSNAQSVTWSSDGGATWHTSTRVSSDDGRAYHARLVRGVAGELSLIWLEISTDGRRSLRIARWSSGDSAWIPGDRARVATQIGPVSALRTRDGTVHVLLAGPDESPGAPIHRAYADGQWTESILPRMPGYVVPSPTLTAAPDGERLLAWWSIARDQGSLPVTLVSVGRPVCGAPARATHR